MTESTASTRPVVSAVIAAVVLGVLVMSSAVAGDRIIRMATYALPPGKGNPFSQTNLPAILVWPAVLEPLTVMGDSGEVQPWLATAWHAVDEFTWRFRLREGVYFSNGERFDAHAVVAVFDWLSSPAAATQMMAGEVRNISGVRAISSHEIEITTHTPDIMLPRALTVVRMVPPAYWYEVGPAAFSERPVGTGPFIVEEWSTLRVRMRAWPGSWQPPRVEGLEILELPDAPARIQGIQSRALDIALQLSPDDAPAVRVADAALHPAPAGSIIGLSFILTRPSPLSDVRVRRALNMAVDTHAIVRELFHGTTHVATQHASRHAFGYHPGLDGYPYDPDAARALLTEAGYPDGFHFVAQVVIGAGANDSAVYQQIAASLREIGVTLELRIMPTQLLLRNIFTGEWRSHAFGMDYGAAPFLDAWRPFRIHSCLWAQPWFCDESLTPLIESVRTTFDLERRREGMHTLLEAYHAAVPSIPVYEVMRYDAVSSRVQNFRNTFGVINFHELELAGH